MVEYEAYDSTTSGPTCSGFAKPTPWNERTDYPNNDYNQAGWVTATCCGHDLEELYYFNGKVYTDWKEHEKAVTRYRSQEAIFFLHQNYNYNLIHAPVQKYRNRILKQPHLTYRQKRRNYLTKYRKKRMY